MFTLITKTISKAPLSTLFLSPRHSTVHTIPQFIPFHFYQTSHSVSVFSQTNIRRTHSLCFSFKDEAEKNLEGTFSKPIIIHFQHSTQNSRPQSDSFVYQAFFFSSTCSSADFRGFVFQKKRTPVIAA